MLAIDTLKLAEDLMKGGFNERQTRAVLAHLTRAPVFPVSAFRQQIRRARGVCPSKPS